MNFDNEPIIYTTGAFLRPMKVTNSEGREIWIWYVSKFDDDSFKDGQTYNPKEFAKSKAELLTSLALNLESILRHW